MNHPPFNRAEYSRAPVINISNGITLARELASNCSDSMPEMVLRAKAKLISVADQAQGAQAAREKAQNSVTTEDSRLIDRSADGSWAAFRMRLLGYAMLPVEQYPLSIRAGELVVGLFGNDGLSFTNEPYPVQLTRAGTILLRIDTEGLQPDIDRIAGPEFLQNIRMQHERYRGMVSSMLSRDTSDENLLEHVRALQSAISSYANKVCALVEDDDPKSIELARMLLRPMDMLRASIARTASSKASEPTAPQPSPAPPSNPPAPAPTTPSSRTP